MCGIAGFFSNKKSLEGIEYYQAHKRMSNRGPDDEGFCIFDRGNAIQTYGDRTINSLKNILLDIRKCTRITGIISHVRLSIIDLSPGGHQPYTDQDKRLAMVFNGEIYNYQELRKELEEKGWLFKTSSDTEVLFYAYQEWGNDCFNRLNGMWAVAFYDYINDKLVLSRDRFGVKPLFYSFEKGETIFASELKVIMALKKQNKINQECVKKYLEKSILCNNEKTLIEDIFEVQPGCVLTICNNKSIRIEKYWTYNPVAKKYTVEEAREQFEYLFRDSIRLRMRSDVEVGSLLSGGLDSNVIAGTLHDEGLISHGYKTFSSVYEDKRFSEEYYIKKTIDKLDICSDLLYITPEMVMGCIDEALSNLEMPTRAVPMMLQYLLYQRISQVSNVKVVLNGQGADELFGGYNVDYITRFLQLWYERRVSSLASEVLEYQNNRHVGLIQILFGMKGQASIGHRNKKNAFNEISFHQVTETPLREYLMYDDRAAMSFGIENRAPFLDYRIVEFAFSLPSDLKININQNKAVVRDYARKNKIVDEDILNRKDKMGFVSPQEIWQKNEWKEEFDSTFELIRSFGIAGMEGNNYYRLYQQYTRGQYEDWAKIWRIYCLFRWINTISKQLPV